MVQRFKQFTKKKVSKKEPRWDPGHDTGLPATGVQADVTRMTIGDEYIQEAHFLNAYRHPHRGEGPIFKTTANSEHEIQKHLGALQRFADRNKEHYQVSVQYNHGERHGEVVHHRIKPAVKEALDQADEIGGETNTDGTKDAPKSAKRLQRQSDRRVEQKQKLVRGQNNRV